MSAPRASASALRPNVESTIVLLERVRAGDQGARDRLMARYLPVLRRWAHGRLPARARGMVDTDDLVQITLLRALNHLEGFEPTREGAFLAWLRSILLNSLRDQLRVVARRPRTEPLSEEHVDLAPSPIERAVGIDLIHDYEVALGRLPEEQQEAIILRIEFGFTYQEIADAMLRPSANATRMMVARALVRLAEAMDETP